MAKVDSIAISSTTSGFELTPEAHLRDMATGTTELTLRVSHGIFVTALSPTGQQVAVVQRESVDNALVLRRYALPDLAPLGPAQPRPHCPQ